jgi:hypothetical protein
MSAGNYRFAVKVHDRHAPPCGNECNVIRNFGQEDPVLANKHPAHGKMPGQSGLANPIFTSSIVLTLAISRLNFFRQTAGVVTICAM